MPDDALPLIAETLGELKALTASMKEDVGEIKSNFKAHTDPKDSIHAIEERRIGSMEKWMIAIKAIGGALLFASPIFIVGIRESIADLLGIGG